MSLSKSHGFYVLLVIVLGLAAAANVFLDPGAMLGGSELPASKPVLAMASFFTMLILYGGLGLSGLWFAKRVGFAGLLDDAVSVGDRVIVPTVVGIGIGVFFILSDLLFSQFHQLGKIPHPAFPASVTASIAAAIGEEIVFRLFLVSFGVWVFSRFVPAEKWRNAVFWPVATLSALIFAAGHIPSAMLILNVTAFGDLPVAILAEIFVLNGVVSLFAAGYFRQSGFLAAVCVHFWTDVVWHVIYGLF